MTRAPKRPPKLQEENFIELAANIGELVVDQWAMDTGRQTWVDVGPGESRYTDQAQEVFNEAYENAVGLLTDMFGPPKE
jgi:hypothetical protein